MITLRTFSVVIWSHTNGMVIMLGKPNYGGADKVGEGGNFEEFCWIKHENFVDFDLLYLECLSF